LLWFGSVIRIDFFAELIEEIGLDFSLRGAEFFNQVLGNGFPVG
jgi:hypothetical protein